MGKILFLTQVLPYPLNTGAKVRAYYVLRHLSQNHQVTLTSFVRGDDDASAIEHLQQYCDTVHTVPMIRSTGRTGRAALRSFLTGEPLIVERDEIPAMYELIENVMKEVNYDYVHADQTSMVRYALWARDRSVNHQARPVVTILDAHNVLFKVVQRLATNSGNPLMRSVLKREARLLAAYESDAYARFDHVIFVTEEDRDNFTLPEASVIPICRDTTANSPVQTVPEPRRVTFIGPLHWPPNAEGVRWFLSEVWLQVAERDPDALLTIVGVDPPADLVKAGQEATNIEVTGYVDDLTPYLAETAAFIVPLHAGGGMRVKIIDAWMWGLPVVSTSIGAEGVAVEDGHNALIADDTIGFSNAILRLREEADLASRLRRNGRMAVESRYDWREVYTGWDEVYRFEVEVEVEVETEVKAEVEVGY